MDIVGIAQVAATVFLAITIYIYWRQAKVMEAQLNITKEQIKDLQGSRSRQQFYEVVTRLLEIKDDIERVLELEGKNLKEWTKNDLASASTVCARFHLVGILVIEDLVPEKLLSSAWYYSIPECHKILQPYLQEIRRKRGQKYWSAFDVLNKRVLANTNTFKGFS